MAPITRPMLLPACRSGSTHHLQLDAMAGIDAGLDSQTGNGALTADDRHLPLDEARSACDQPARKLVPRSS